MNHIKNFFLFYCSPFEESGIYLSIRKKLIGSIFLLILTFLALFTFEVIIPVIFISLGIVEHWPGIKTSLTKTDMTIALITVSLVPLVEEIVGRLWLIYDRTNISLSISLALGITIYKLFGRDPGLLWFENYNGLIISLLISIITFISARYILKLKEQEYLRSFWTVNSRKLIVLSTIIFAGLHYSRYNMENESILLVPLLLAFYFFSGLILVYTRIRYGFIYCCLIHILYNSSLLSVKYIL